MPVVADCLVLLLVSCMEQIPLQAAKRSGWFWSFYPVDVFLKILALFLWLGDSLALSFNGSFSFSIGLYKKETFMKRITLRSVRLRYEDHPCHGCLCFAPPSEDEGWSHVTEKSLVLFNVPIIETSTYPYNFTESGCFFSPEGCWN